jgi:hypothetical protein
MIVITNSTIKLSWKMGNRAVFVVFSEGGRFAVISLCIYVNASSHGVTTANAIPLPSFRVKLYLSAVPVQVCCITAAWLGWAYLTKKVPSP